MDLENKLNPAVTRRGFVGAAAAGAAALGLAATRGAAPGVVEEQAPPCVAEAPPAALC